MATGLALRQLNRQVKAVVAPALAPYGLMGDNVDKFTVNFGLFYEAWLRDQNRKKTGPTIGWCPFDLRTRLGRLMKLPGGNWWPQHANAEQMAELLRELASEIVSRGLAWCADHDSDENWARFGQ
jgi:hypothetical protein